MHKTAIVTIDIQKDYFVGGAFPLWRSGRALRQTKKLLDVGRARGLPIFHVHHENVRPDALFFRPGTAGLALHEGLGIREGEILIHKHFPNSFRGTELEATLRALGVERVIWAGMMTWMCVDTTVRAAKDLGFDNVLIADATASGIMLATGGRGLVMPWTTQRTFLAALSFVHARVINLRTFLHNGPSELEVTK